MAVLDAVPGLKVEVFVDGVPLQEYDDDDTEAERFEDDTDGDALPDTVTKYVEATSGAHFKIHSPSMRISTTIALDSRRVLCAKFTLMARKHSVVLFDTTGRLSLRNGQFTEPGLSLTGNGTPRVSVSRLCLSVSETF